jgi:hypothetical protein
MNNDTIKLQKIKGYTKLINDIQELIYKYNNLSNDGEITDTTHEAVHERLTMFENELMNYIKLVANS